MKDNKKGNNYEFVTKHMSKICKLHSQAAESILQRVQSLQADQQVEWASILLLKAQSLLSQKSQACSPDLTEAAIVLVVVAHKLKCPYDTQAVEQVLKQIYIRENENKMTNGEITKVLKSVNFDCGDYQYYEYEDPWYNRLYRFFAD